MIRTTSEEVKTEEENQSIILLLIFLDSAVTLPNVVTVLENNVINVKPYAWGITTQEALLDCINYTLTYPNSEEILYY